MAWNLRQFFEGDKVLTVSGVASGSGICWTTGGNTYVPSTIAIKFGGVERIMTSGIAIANGIAVIQVPSDIFISPTTTIQVYAVCEDTPDTKTATLTAKPVNFQVSNTVLKACNSQVILNSDLDEYVRFFVSQTAGDFFNAKLNGVNMDMADFDYQAGDSGNIVSVNGDFSRPAGFATSASLISKVAYTGVRTLAVVANTTQYFTARLGYIEIVFTGTNMKLNNYLNASEFDVDLGTYVAGDGITIEAQNSQYIINRTGTSPGVVGTKPKTIAYAVSGGSVTPAISTVGTAVAWTLPALTAGSYTFTVTIGDALQFQKTVSVHSCADAIDDTYQGVLNTPYSGDVGTNDTKCVGETSYFDLVAGSAVGGTPVVNQNGTFTFTPTLNFNGTGTFRYNIRCGTTFGNSEIVDTATVTINYFDPCNNVVADWKDDGRVDCQSCVEVKGQSDANAQCTGNVPRWVPNPGGSACNKLPNLVPTGETRCQACVNQREVQDLNTCSPTYQLKTWETNPTGTDCNRVPNWVNTGATSCLDCVEKREVRDINTCSPTYNQIEQRDNSGGTKCTTTPILITTGEFVCINCIEYEKKTDMNLCSSTFGQIINVPSYTGVVCNTLPVWVDTGVTKCEGGLHYKEQESSNPCSVERRQFIETGLQLCGCLGYIRYTNKCTDDEIVGVMVRKTGVNEGNRLISYNSGTIVFQQDEGTFSYTAVIMRSSGMPVNVTVSDQKCTPLT